MGRLFFFIVFLLVSNNALGQTPILRVVPANSVGMVVTITFPPSPTPIDYKLYYRVQGSGQYIYETTFPVPVIVTNTPGEHIIPVSIFNQSDMYEFKLEEVSNPNNQTVVLQSFSEEWCSSTSDILHSFNHPISGNSGTPSYPHEGLDIMGGGNPIYAPRGGWVAQLSVSGQNEQIVLGMYNSSYSGLINPLVPQPPGVIEVVEFNHVVPYNLVSGSSVYPGQLLGHIGVNNSINGPFCTSCENHVHVGYSIDGVTSSQMGWRNPLEMFQEPANQDPDPNSPQLFDVDGNQEMFRFCQNKLAGSSGQISYFQDPIIQSVLGQIWGGVDIVVEAVDLQAGNAAPFAIPYEIGYRVEKEVSNGQWDNAVNPYKLYKSDKWLPAGSCASPTADCSSFIEALADRSIYDQSGWREYQVLIPTNTSANSGLGSDISQNDCWATDARDDVSTANGYTSNYNQARCVQEAKFPDGKYKAVVNMADVVNTSSPVEKEVIVDNFKPFVEKVRVATNGFPNGGGAMIYEARRQWEGNAGQLGLLPYSECCNGGSRISGTADPAQDDVYIEVTFSEPMDESTLPMVNVPSLGSNSAVWASTSSDGKTFTYYVSNATLQNNGGVAVHVLNIEGQDIAGNELTGFDQTSQFIPASDIPRRLENGNWSVINGSAQDITHRFKLFLCEYTEVQYVGSGNNATPTSPCIAPNFSGTPLSGSAPLTVDFTDLTSSAAPIVYWLWTFGDGSSASYTSSNVPNTVSHIYTSQGDYTVRLTVTDAAGESDFEEKVQYIQVTSPTGGPTGGAVDVDFTVNFTNPDVNEPVTFTGWTVNTTGNLVYAWEFPGGTPSVAYGQEVPYVTYPLSGYYDVTLTVTENGIALPSVIKEDYIYVSDNSVPISFSGECMEMLPDPTLTSVGFYTPNQIINFSSLGVSGGTAPYSYTWRFLDGNTLLGVVYGSNAFYSFPVAGTYTVELSVDDLNPNTQAATCTTTVSISNPGQPAGLNISVSPTVINSNQVVSLDGTYVGNMPIYNLYWKFDCDEGEGPCTQDWLMPYNGTANWGILDDDVWAQLQNQGAVTQELSSGTWSVSLQVGDDASPTIFSNAVQVVVGQPPASQPIRITGAGFYNGQCWEPGNNLSIQPYIQVRPESTPYWGEVADPGNCTSGSIFPFPNCPCAVEWVSGSIYTTGAAELFSSGDWYFLDGNVCPGYEQTFGRLDLNSYDWELNGPISTVATLNATDWTGVTYFEIGAYELAQQFTSTYEKPLTIYRCLTEAEAGEDIYACPRSTFILGGTLQSGVKGPVTYSWSGAPGEGVGGGPTPSDYLSDVNVGNPVITVPNGTTTLVLTITDAFGNTVTDEVTILGSYVVADAGPSQNLCLGNSLPLPGSATGGSGTGYSYAWYPTTGLNNPSVQSPLFTPTANGVYTYTVTVTDDNGCTDTDQVTITVDDQKPIVSAGDDMVSCPGGFVTLDVDATGATGNYTYDWTPQPGTVGPDGSYSISAPLSNTAYRVTVTDANGCAGEDQISVFIDNELSEGVRASSGVPQSQVLQICAMGDFELTGIPFVAGTYAYEWSWENSALGTEGTAQGSPASMSTMGSQTYHLEAQNLTTGCISWDDVDVIVDPQLGPTATIISDQAVCYGEELEVSATVSGGQPSFSYQWFLGASDMFEVLFNPATTATAYANGSPASIQYADVASYVAANGGSTADIYLVVTDVDGCGSYSFAQVSANPQIGMSGFGLYSRPITNACTPITIGEQVFIVGGTPPYSTTWLHADLQMDDPNSLVTTCYPEHSVFVDLEVKDSNGCSIKYSTHYGRYKRINCKEPLPFEFMAESPNGVYCVGEPICLNSIVSSYIPMFDYTTAISDGLYNGNPSSLATFDGIQPMQPTQSISAVFGSLNFNNLIVTSNSEVLNHNSGCIFFSDEGQQVVEYDYQGVCSQNVTGSVVYDIQPQTTFPPQFLTEYITGPIALASPQNNKVGVVLKVAVDANQNQIPTVIPPGIQADHIAAERVSLRAGFRAVSGSDYTAMLNPCMEFGSGKFAEEEEEEEDTISLHTRTLENRNLLVADIAADGEFFNVYPNPNTGDFTVSCSNLKRLTVLDAAGRVVWDSNRSLSLEPDQTEADILISGFSNGVYIVRAERKNGAMRFRKVVVN